MWNRSCPLCFARVPRALLLTRVDDLSCPSCHAALELSRPSRVLGAAVGLGAAYALVRFTRNPNASAGWALTVLEAVLAYAVASAITLFFFSDLVVRPKPPSGNFPHPHG